MTGAELITEFLADQRFGQSRARVLGFLNFRYGEMLALEDWSFLWKTDTVTLNAAIVALPANAGVPTDLLLNDTGDPLEAVQPAVYESMFLGAPQTGRPEIYTVVGTNLLIGPTPDTSYAATLVHRGDAADLADGSVTPVTPSWTHAALVAGAQAYALELENDPTGQALEARYQRTIDGMRRRYLRLLRGTHDQMGSWAPG